MTATVYWALNIFDPISLTACSGEGCLIVQWKDEPEHTGIFPLKFLKANCYTKESLENKRNTCRMTFSKEVSKRLTS